MNARRIALFLIVVAAVIIAAAAPAFAQCPMCKAAIENSTAAQSASSGLDLAIIILLIPPVAIFAGFFVVIYRFRNVQGRKHSTNVLQ
ncbi:MAG TPA: hypothetical protein VNN73_05650 [Blastocatellia bacterium]|nr:hypothetical protein [Blastocatellia bacterium]